MVEARSQTFCHWLKMSGIDDGHGPVSHASAAKIVTIYLWTEMVTAAVYRTITSLLQIDAFTEMCANKYLVRF